MNRKKMVAKVTVEKFLSNRNQQRRGHVWMRAVAAAAAALVTPNAYFPVLSHKHTRADSWTAD